MIPKYYDMFVDVLEYLKDGEVKQLQDIVKSIGDKRNLTEEEKRMTYQQSKVLI